MKFKNSNRIFISNFNIVDSRGYVQVTDDKTKVIFWLPKEVLNKMKFTFCWDTFKSDMLEDPIRKEITKQVLIKELKRLEAMPQTENTTIGIKNMMESLVQFN